MNVTVSCLVTFVALEALAPTASAQIGPSRRGDLTLALECLGSGQIAFEIKNVGATDTTLRLGAVLGNGNKYMVDGLDLIVTTPGEGQTTEQRYGYSPRDYPAAISGSLGDWFEPLPTRSVYRMSAKPDDFFLGLLSARLVAFPPETELSLRWTIRDPRPQAMLLRYWSGTLTSNSCRPVP